jgi:VPDSG-CTERM motif
MRATLGALDQCDGSARSRTALAPLDQANAIAINPESFGWSQAEIAHSADPGSAHNSFDRENFPVGDIKKFDHETEATLSNQYGTSTSNATWTLKSNPNKTVYGASYTLDGSGSRQTYADVVTELHFTLLESASYSIAASFDGFFVPDEESTTNMGASLRRLDTGNETVRSGGKSNSVGGTFRLAFGGPDLAGILEAGDYIFEFHNYLMIREQTDGQSMSGVGFGSGTGQFELTLSRTKDHGNHVPDAGSTLTLLGIALGGLRFMRRR